MEHNERKRGRGRERVKRGMHSGCSRQREVAYRLSVAGTDRSKYYSAGFSTDRSITISPDYAFNIVARHAVPRPRPVFQTIGCLLEAINFLGFQCFAM